VEFTDTSNNRGNSNHPQIIQEIPEKYPGKHGTKELQHIAILGTAHVLRKLLM